MKTVPNPEMAYSQPCGCGTPAGVDCPHTPIRCPHKWSYGPRQTADYAQQPGDQRECEYCGRVEKARLDWETVVA